jgi:glyoxylase-like metal-dependent hydrolase (beta-lactamase superfamily II)
MKRAVKRTLTVISVLFGILLIAALVFLFNFIKATKKFTPSSTQAINDSVWCIKDKFVNAYLFRGKTGYILFDAGFSKKNISAELIKLGIREQQVKTIMLTHTDSDHTGSIGLFENPVIYMERDEEQMINGTTGKTKFFKTKWKYGPYKLLNNNDSLNIDGIEIKIIHTPGHTPGSACYIVGSDYFVTGDNTQILQGKYEQFVDNFNMDTQVQIESLKKLPPVKQFVYILTAHYGIISVNP